MSVRATLVFGAIACAALATAPSAATTMPDRGPAEVAAASELIVEGTVLDARVQVAGGRIVTVRTVRVERLVRPAPSAPTLRPGSTVTVVLPGGELAGLGQRVAGTPDLAIGERYVLCLSAPVVLGARTIVGLWQGVWRVTAGGALEPFTHAGPAPTALDRAALVSALGSGP